MKRIYIVLIAALLLAGCAPQVATPTPSGLTKIRLPAGYIPDVQFAPIYMALEKGYFTQAGLDVTLDYSQETDGVALVGAGTLQFALASGEQVLLARDQGLPIVYAMVWYQQYPIGLSASPSQQIKTPADLKGKKIGLPMLSGASYIGLRALLQAGGLDLTDVSLEAIGFNQVEALTSGREQAVVTYINNEPLKLAAQGYPVNTLRVADYLQLVGNGLITNETTISQKPELVKAMVGALVKGLQDVIANPDAAYTVCLKYVENLAQADQKVQKQVLTTSIELWKAPRLGYSDPKAWSNMQAILLQMQQYINPLDLSKAFTNAFVP
jgi:NitT/TauT family transport system substrate-binding protein